MRLGTESNYNPSHVCPYLQPLVGWDGVHPPDVNWEVGTSTDPLYITAGTEAIVWTFDSSSTSGSTSVVPFKTKMTMSGDGGVGGRVYHHMYTNAALGGWANALKAYTEFGASGSVTGLGSAICGELALSAGTTGGSYAALEAELVLGSGASTGTATSFLYAGVSGAAAGTFDDNGYFFELAGLTEGDGHIFDATDSDDIDMTHALKVRINGTTYYLALSTAKDFTD